ncbi:MAG: hypothetical protein H7Z21_16885 [Hymenobacter sp.]|nr:hypothetical protein [Hymenobacter sp.]
MLRIISCQQATLLVEQRAALPLAPVDCRSLWLHLRYCPYCSRYANQSAVLGGQARAAAGHAAASLPVAARERLRQLVTDTQPPAEK